jgi:surfactin synthase thioesterase subunit
MNSEKINLYCIPYSGGNFNSYAGFRKYLPAHIEMINLELPGRGKRISEPLLYNIEEMVSDLFGQIKDNLHRPYAIYGHSLGALLGFILCRYIHAKNIYLPERLFVSGQTAPALIKSDNTHLLPDNDFKKTLRDMGGTPDEILDDRGFMEFFFPVIRADFESISNYNYEPGNVPLDVPITIMLGYGEEIADKDNERWQEETVKSISIHKYPGGHFFIFDNMKEICGLITDKLIKQ